MSWRKLAIVQLAQKIFTQKSGESVKESVVVKKHIVKKSDDSNAVETTQAVLKEEAKEAVSAQVSESEKEKKKEEKKEVKKEVKKSAAVKKKETKTPKSKTAEKKEAGQKQKKEKKQIAVKTKKTDKTSSKEKAPSKKEQKLKLYREDIKKHLGSVDEAFLETIVKNLGPSIYRKDAESVACSDPKELETVKNNFLVKKLQMPKDDKEALDAAVAEVCEKLKGVKTKYRATFYYMLAKNLKKESLLS